MDHPSHIVAVAGLISNAEQAILLVRSPRRGWEFPGGQVEVGETLIQALKREVREEAGIDISVGTLVGVYSNLRPPSKVMFGFLGQWVDGELSTSSESLETEWVQRHDALRRISHPAIYDRLRDMLEFSGSITYRAYTINPYEVIAERRI
jgi:8-oxo-dGTP diphosphatase